MAPGRLMLKLRLRILNRPLPCREIRLLVWRDSRCSLCLGVQLAKAAIMSALCGVKNVRPELVVVTLLLKYVIVKYLLFYKEIVSILVPGAFPGCPSQPVPPWKC